MHLNVLVWLGLFLLVYYLLGGRKGVVALTQPLRVSSAMKAVMTAYRAGDYETAIEKAETLKDGAKKTPEYCCVRGEMLHHSGRLDEAEASLREALPLHNDPREKA